MNTITGTVIHHGKQRNAKEKTYSEFVIRTNETYPQCITLETDAMPPALGANITAQYVVNGREWVSNTGEKKYFNTLKVLKFTLA